MASNRDWTASWWNDHSLSLNASSQTKIYKGAQVSDKESPVSSGFSPTSTSPTTDGQRPSPRTKQSALQRLFHHRQSGETRATSSYSDFSAFSTPRSTSFDQVSDSHPPFMPALRQKAAANGGTPPTRPYEQSPAVVTSDTITYSELAHIWTHAAHLSHTNRNESARLLFTHLLGRSGIPPHLVALLPLNAGLIMLKEDALFPALHTFHVTARELCPSGPLAALAMFLMAVAAWNIAASAASMTGHGSSFVNSVADIGTEQSAAGSNILGKSRLFFRMCLEEIGGVEDALDYTSLGLRWQLQRCVIVQNIDACDRVAAFAQVGLGGAAAYRRVTIVRPPDGVLFMPAELATETLRSCARPHHLETEVNGYRPQCPDIGSPQIARGNTSRHNASSRLGVDHEKHVEPKESEIEDTIAAYHKRMAKTENGDLYSGLKYRLMKELPPIPTNKRHNP